MSNLKISEERINQFLSGRDPMMGIVNIECGYQDEQVSVIYKDPTYGKKVKKFDFFPFVWAKQEGARKLFIDPTTGKQNTSLLRTKMSQYGITAKGLNIHDEDGNTTDRLENGYRVLFQATRKTSFNKLLMFFKQGGMDVYGKEKLFLAVTPVEQYMMKSGKRMFKGFEDYDELHRLNFDIETQGLDAKIHGIEQIGISNNKGFEYIITVEGETPLERKQSELVAIHTLFEAINNLKPDVITGYNSENFDWQYIITRCEVLGTDIKDVSGEYFYQPLYKKKKPTVLKLGGETEYFNQTILWGYNITDTLHAVRRAQAIDSNMKLANLKYVTKYSKLEKSNRVYVPGDSISKIWNDTHNDYAFNNNNGDWFCITDEKPIDNSTHEIVTGKYIVERYLLDDLYETDKVELRYNQANFLLSKILPTTFSKVCTMGTAGTWKLIMMAWSYENNLAIPDFAPAGKFTGGLSRLLSVGFVDRVVKLDYNSLYPAITLTWDIKPSLDITNVMMSLLGFILDKREEYKDLKSDAKNNYESCKVKLKELINEAIKESIEKEIKHWQHIESSNDKKQLPFKIFANSFFGSFGAPNLFPWGDLKSAEKITCIGRQSLRLMTYWFKERGYKAIVGDSFLYDTPVYIKYDETNLIDIKSIGEIFNSNYSDIDELGREYDLSHKDYKVLCRGGWVDVNYIYRHKTDKKIHRISFGNGYVDVTSDHSVFNENKEKLHSKEVIPNETKLEMFNINYDFNSLNCEHYTDDEIFNIAYHIATSVETNKKIPIKIINSNKNTQLLFLNNFIKITKDKKIKHDDNNKVLKSGILFLMNSIKNN